MINSYYNKPSYQQRYGGFYAENLHHGTAPAFTAMKKSQFEGENFAAVEKYKAPIEKFNSHNDLQLWADERYNEIREHDYSGRSIDTLFQRKMSINKWSDSLDKNGYSPVEKLIIMKDMTKNLKTSDSSNLPVFNQTVLDKTLDELKQSLSENKKTQFDFSKSYQKNLTKFYIQGSEFNENESKWIIIPSKTHDPENFDENVKKLQNFSCKGWCTRGKLGRDHLASGDFHIYMEKGQPKIGIRFDNNAIAEFQDKNNNGRVNPEYFDTLKSYLEDNKFKMKSNAVMEYYSSEKAKEKSAIIKHDIGKDIENNNTEKIFNYFGMDVKHDKDGGMILSNYALPKGINYSDFGVNEDKLFKDVVKIEGDADFSQSELTSTHNLKTIGGDTTFTLSKIKDLPNLENIGGNAVFTESRLESTGALENVGSIDLKNSRIKDLGVLENVDENFRNSPFLTSLKNLKTIGGNADFNSNFNSLTDLGDLEYIGGNCNMSNIELDSLNNLNTIEGDANFQNAKIKTLNKLECIGGDADFTGATIDDIGNLEEIGGRIIAPKYSIDDSLRYKLGNLSSQDNFSNRHSSFFN